MREDEPYTSIIEHHKLVRDRIPELILADGRLPITEELDAERYLHCLKEKLSEECREYRESASPAEALEELADLLEVMQALLDAEGISWKQLEQTRLAKRQKRGGFTRRVFLREVRSPASAEE